MIIGLTKSKTRCNLYFKGETGVEYIKKLGESDTTNLAYDDTDDNNLRYIGANPNNYVRFNDELWRIIGVLKVKTENGTTEERLKIIRTNGIEGQKDFTKFSWDYKLTNVGSSTSEYGSNDWTDSQLKDMLNGIYYNSTSGDCYFGKSEASQCDFSNLCNDEVERTTTWDGYLALMYPSDFGYAVGGETRNDCLMQSLYNWDLEICKKNDWILLPSNQWTITPVPVSFLAYSAVYINSKLQETNTHVHIAHAIRPAGYLKSTTKIIENDKENYGSKENPFIIY